MRSMSLNSSPARIPSLISEPKEHCWLFGQNAKGMFALKADGTT